MSNNINREPWAVWATLLGAATNEGNPLDDDFIIDNVVNAFPNVSRSMVQLHLGNLCERGFRPRIMKQRAIGANYRANMAQRAAEINRQIDNHLGSRQTGMAKKAAELNRQLEDQLSGFRLKI